MNKLLFGLVAATGTLTSLGAVATRYHARISPEVQPFVAVYKITSQRDGKPQIDSYLTLAVRKDGTHMTSNSTPVGSQLPTARSIELKDRYIVVDPVTESISTYKAYKPLIHATQDCGGTPDARILGFETEVSRKQPRGAPTGQETTTTWQAIGLNCAPIREEMIFTVDSTRTVITKEVISLQLGEPPATYFDVPNYQERGPVDLDNEVNKRLPGKHAFGSQKAIDNLQKVYETSRPE